MHEKFCEHGVKPGQVSHPTAITLATLPCSSLVGGKNHENCVNIIVIVDYKNSRVQILDKHSKKVVQVIDRGEHLGLPVAVAVLHPEG